MPTLVRRPVMAPLRDWLRAHPSISADVWVGSLPKEGASLPAVVLTRVGDGPPAEWLQSPLVQADCISEDGPTAEALAAAVETALHVAAPETVLGTAPDAIRLMGAETLSTVALPDPDDTRRQRYVVTFSLTAKAVEAP